MSDREPAFTAGKTAEAHTAPGNPGYHGGASHQSSMDEALSPAERRRRTIVRFLPIALAVLVLLLILASLAFYRSADVEVGRRDLIIAPVTVRSITEEARLVGRATPTNLTEISAPESGQIAEVFVVAGQQVAAGDPLVRIANPERELAISERMSRIRSDMMALVSRESEMLSAEASEQRMILDADEAAIEARGELRRRETLLGSGVVTEAHVQPLRERLRFAERKAAESRQFSARSAAFRRRQQGALASQLSGLRADYEAAGQQLEALTIRAPLNGVVLGLEATVGQSLQLGARVAGIDPLEGLRVVSQLDEFYAGRIRPGLQARAEISGTSYPLRVVHVSPDIRDGTFRAELEFVGGQPHLRPGESVQGSISLPGEGRFVAIPIGPYLEHTGGNWIFVVSPDGRTAQRRGVTSGIRSSTHIAITQGLQEGESVITSSYRNWSNVNTIRISQ